MTKTAIFIEDHLLRICEVLAGSPAGLTGTEIGTFLLRLEMPDPGAGVRKKTRLFEALIQRQKRDEDGRAVLTFIQAAMDPGRYVGTAQLFETRRESLNQVLLESQLYVAEDGKVHKLTIEEKSYSSEERIVSLRQTLTARALHPDVSNIILEGISSLTNFKIAANLVRALSDRIRTASGLTCDGAELVDRAFGGHSVGRLPLVALSDPMTDSGRSEQACLMSLIKGTLGTFRGVSGYAPRIPWEISEADLLDLAALTSLLHRKLDHAESHTRSHELVSKKSGTPQILSH